jgi:hypothetical protein
MVSVTVMHFQSSCKYDRCKRAAFNKDHGFPKVGEIVPLVEASIAR